MKRKSLYIGVAVLTVAMGFSSCSDSYLDVEPVTDIPESSMSGDPTVAKVALAGLYESMNRQYSVDLNGNCGEAYVNTVVFDCYGNDYISGIWTLPGLQAWSRLSNDRLTMTTIAWDYYYGLIGQANRIISAIPYTSESENVDQLEDKSILLYKAESLTMRAHSYTKLMSLFANRWSQSDNGKAYCIVLRTEPTTDPMPLATQNEVYGQIYADLEEACKLYDLSGLDRDNKWEVNKNVANGIWSRAALLKEDWQTAADKAREAREGFKVAEGDMLFTGYIVDSDDVMWSMEPGFETTYYMSWGSHYACNGAYVTSWGFGAGAINIDLYNKLDPKDERRKFFFMPDKVEAMNRIANPAKLKKDAFWNPGIVDQTEFLNLGSTNVYDRSGKDKNGYGMVNCVANWAYDYLNNIFKGDRSLLAAEDDFYNYIWITKKQGELSKSVRVSPNEYAQVCKLPFGAQLKFFGCYPYGNSQYPWMRASEMALTEAEALCMLGKESEAKQVFDEFQSKRVAGFKSTKSGDALLDEIRTSRRAELWGEGHNFTDLKRWEMEHVRREWKAGDVNSGNVAPGENITDNQKSINYCNGWRLPIPASEREYNNAIDLGLLPKF